MNKKYNIFYFLLIVWYSFLFCRQSPKTTPQVMFPFSNHFNTPLMSIDVRSTLFTWPVMLLACKQSSLETAYQSAAGPKALTWELQYQLLRDCRVPSFNVYAVLYVSLMHVHLHCCLKTAYCLHFTWCKLNLVLRLSETLYVFCLTNKMSFEYLQCSLFDNLYIMTSLLTKF